MPTNIWIWIAALLTLCIFSFLYKDNPLYKFAEHLFVGVSAGYGIAVTWHNGVLPNLIIPLKDEHNYWFIIPAILGLLFLARFSSKWSYLMLLPLSFVMGANAGMSIPPIIQADIIKQMEGTIFSTITINAVILFVGVICTLAYFFFSREQKGLLKAGARIGIWFIMIGFGASFGYTVMARFSLLIGRVQFLLSDWLHLIP